MATGRCTLSLSPLRRRDGNIDFRSPGMPEQRARPENGSNITRAAPIGFADRRRRAPVPINVRAATTTAVIAR